MTESNKTGANDLNALKADSSNEPTPVHDAAAAASQQTTVAPDATQAAAPITQQPGNQDSDPEATHDAVEPIEPKVYLEDVPLEDLTRRREDDNPLNFVGEQVDD